MNDSDEEILVAFLDESRENLDQLDRQLLGLEVDPCNLQLLAQIFRTFHTIKGTCGFLGYRRLETLTHAGENLLGALRSGEVRLDAAVTTALLQLVDAVRGTLERIEQTGSEGDDDHAAVIASLERPLQADEQKVGDGAPVAVADGVEEGTQAVGVEPDDPTRAPIDHGPTTPETTVRLDVAVLDKLMDLVGELVLTRNQFGASSATHDEGELSGPYRQLRIVTSELQDGVMQARLQPVGTITRRLRRVVRDLATAMGKDVGLDIEGESIGVDKAVNEALRDPLLHLVRNAVDHGIEAPDERRAAGKQARGMLRLRVFQEGGRVHIELADDGRGIDAGRIVDKAVARGVLSRDDALALGPEKALELIFHPGLSTKDEVTHVSGRGVGLDVVRSAVHRMGGNVDVRSQPGLGSVFRLSVPPTLTIVPALIAAVGSQRFAVPQADVREVVLLANEAGAAVVHELDGALVLRLRDRLVPLVDLADLLGLEAADRDGDRTVMVVDSAGRRYGIFVDDVDDAGEVVVKPLTSATQSIRAFGGVTILSDGQLALILDVAGLASRGGIAVARAAERPAVTVELEHAGPRLVIASGTDGTPIAVDMAVVRHLEQIPIGAIQWSGPVAVVHSHGGIVPLIHDAAVLGGNAPAVGPSEFVDAVICDSSVGLVGIVVGHIEDVAARPPVLPQPPSRQGTAARLVVDGRVTELLDVEAIVAAAGIGRQG